MAIYKKQYYASKGQHFTSASLVLDKVFTRAGMKRRLKRANTVLLWREVVGDGVARFSEAKAFRDGVLYVEVQDSETAMHLTHQRHRFLDVYHNKFQLKELKDIQFRVGRLARASGSNTSSNQKQQAKFLPPEPKALARAAKEISQLELPEELATVTMQTAKTMLSLQATRLAQGNPTCVVCQAVLDSQPAAEPSIKNSTKNSAENSTTRQRKDVWCRTCTRYAQDIKVQRASRQVAGDPMQPTPTLSEDERLVALQLGQEYMLEHLYELVPYVLSHPEQRWYLEAVAKSYLAHLLNCSPTVVTPDDFVQLEPQLQRLLGML